MSTFDEFFPPSEDMSIEDLGRAILARLSGASLRDTISHEPNIHIQLRDLDGDTIGTANGTHSAVVSQDGGVLFSGSTLCELVFDGTLVPVRVSLMDASERDLRDGVDFAGSLVTAPGELTISVNHPDESNSQEGEGHPVAFLSSHSDTPT